ncbi:GTP-binding protein BRASSINAZOLE INSENSITIVE PALE GREEN 2, chloroplastic [Impatiens glandulifera]|uniref:GTP-binding protein BRASSINAZOLE INSENSITIVE PALE GREEN 2, chloroplastic n=1 Tax=Impatiens glandulifera TaxID=253017 RepID=UPI001FB0855D|nr:GTP-binding protein BRASSINAZOLE INSENSITIVE PALE GREEN 2, chloroplastic [Impatiens glandulifera]
MAIFLCATTLPSSTNLFGKISCRATSEFNSLSVRRPFTRTCRNSDKRVAFAALSVKCVRSVVRKTDTSSRKSVRKLILSEGRDDDEKHGIICPGCGVFMQDEDPDLPGYFMNRKVETEELSADEDDVDDYELELEEEEEEESAISVAEIENSDNLEEIEDEYEEEEEDDVNNSEDDANSDNDDDDKEEIDWDTDDWESKFEDSDNDSEFDGFAPATVGYGNITEEVIEKQKKIKVSKSEKKRLIRESHSQRDKEELTVCARCHSLRNYGQVKNQATENLIPDFDFDQLITTRLMKPTGIADAIVVVMVVDCVDFDGSFPKRAAKSLFKALEGAKEGHKLTKRLPKLVLVATKVDLLPSQISPSRLDSWVRHRAKAAGAPKLSAVYMVSSRKDLGVRNLLTYIKELAGPRGNVWVIGAQNAGKSTLINAFAKKEGKNITKLTEAAVPGTTLGILRIGGILSAKAKMYDTPGLLHPYLMTMRLNREEQKLVEIRKELQPRTFRIKAAHTIHVGSLVRLDLDSASVDTIYVTIWASPNVSLHLGKLENADEFLIKHAGIRLQPVVGSERHSELGKWKEKEIKVKGTSWDVNSCDIAIAGLGWFSIGLKGEASLRLWIYDGVEVIMREPLVLDRASFLERPGFWLPKAVSDALGNQTRLDAQKRKLLEEEEE